MIHTRHKASCTFDIDRFHETTKLSYLEILSKKMGVKTPNWPMWVLFDWLFNYLLPSKWRFPWLDVQHVKGVGRAGSRADMLYSVLGLSLKKDYSIDMDGTVNSSHESMWIKCRWCSNNATWDICSQHPCLYLSAWVTSKVHSTDNVIN